MAGMKENKIIKNFNESKESMMRSEELNKKDIGLQRKNFGKKIKFTFLGKIILLLCIQINFSLGVDDLLEKEQINEENSTQTFSLENVKPILQIKNTLKGNQKSKDAKVKCSVPLPMIVKKKGKKIIAFMDASFLKKNPKLKYLNFLTKVKNKDIIMISIKKSGKVLYTILDEGLTYDEISSLLLSEGKSVLKKGFVRVIGLFIPPPAGMIIVMGTEYTIDKYIELNKRSYVGLEDMFWDVPDEIKNKITVLNIEETKKEIALDFSELDKETVYDEVDSGNTILEDEESNKRTILEI